MVVLEVTQDWATIYLAAINAAQTVALAVIAARAQRYKYRALELAQGVDEDPARPGSSLKE